jgi:hypothetical protein
VQPTQSGTLFANPEFRRQGENCKRPPDPASYKPGCSGVTRATAEKGELFHDYRRRSPTLLD